MQFLVKDVDEYYSTIQALLKANVYEERVLMHTVHMDIDDKPKLIPQKYPCIVSLEIEECSADNRRYTNSSCKFIYKKDLLSGYDYQDKLTELAILDEKLSELYKILNTSGSMDKPFDKIEKLQKEIDRIEKRLF